MITQRDKLTADGNAGDEKIMNAIENESADAVLATRVAKLWPNRKHEASAVAGLACRAGIHRWQLLDLTSLEPDNPFAFGAQRSE